MVKLKELARLVGGEIKGNENAEISGFCSIEAPREGAISFVESAVHKRGLKPEKLAAVITTSELADAHPNAIVVENPRLAFVAVMEYFIKEQKKEEPNGGIHKLASVDESAEIGKDVKIDAFAVIDKNVKLSEGVHIGSHSYIGEGCEIGRNTRIYPMVTVYAGTMIGRNCIIHAGTVIGSDGFGYVSTPGGHKKVPQVGRVIIEDDVEIGALCSIDRATIDETRIGKGTKIDNLVQIAHNVKIGAHCLIAAQAGFAGRTELGSWSVVGGQAGFQGGIRIGKGSVIAAQSGVFSSLPEGSRVSGYPAKPHRQAMRVLALTWKLPELTEKIKALEEEIRKLKSTQNRKK